MLVHCDNDDKSGDDVPASGGGPHIVDQTSVDDRADDALGSPEAPGTNVEDASLDGKTHLIGDALKSVYQRTLEEDIPDDFLDLLKQLK